MIKTRKICGWRVPEYDNDLCMHCLTEQKQKEKKKPKETVDDIARKAHKHNLSYGKYLAARARGEYLSEVEDD